MKAWYLYHSGFAVETAAHFLVFDYWRDTPAGGGLAAGVLRPEALPREKQPVVFVSHAHHDHFNPVIFSWAGRRPDIQYVLADGLPGGPGARIRPGQRLAVAGLEVLALPSTDQGVAFAVTCDGQRIYHAGDLNWWHWNGEGAAWNDGMARDYPAALAPLAGKPAGLAFVPVDPRLEDKELWGLDYFMRHVGARWVAPMHFWEDTGIFRRIQQADCTRPYRAQVLGPFGRGEQLLPQQP